ncbi:hypothetical protein [Fischerella sp. NIES-3754]|uniref:hypothetical protein n=1 Tax=Fischerella sp. NIES-3754 TaxID=1752063 RepID=UPI000722ED0F|nr:hypothetical protein [Fischerella sp. NIES-3754]BAU08098.1 PAS/PAC sensor hybrid histidine kinase [Fischerella sp. NIES-3754]BCX10459.1 MAG: hypothetical protein KatS3mg066_4318 [Fischerella sp.]
MKRLDILFRSVAISTLQKINPNVKIIATGRLLSRQNLAKSQAVTVKAFLSKLCTAKELLLIITVIKKVIKETYKKFIQKQVVFLFVTVNNN